jgi:hypothetical protein
MFKKILCGATLMCVASFSNAAVMTQNFVVERHLTNFTETITYNLFDDMSGDRILESVEFILLARTSGLADVENRNATSTLITATLSTDIALINEDMIKFVEATPSLTRSEMVASGASLEFLNLLTEELNSAVITNAMALMSYIGTGTGSVDFSAEANSSITGGGNLSSSFTTFASGGVTVIYTYRDAAVSVSAPSQLALVGLSLIGFAGMRKFTK